MDLRKILVLLLISGVIYALFYRAPEVDYGQFSGLPENAPALTGDEVVGHLRLHQNQTSYSAGHGFVLSHKAQNYVVSASHVIGNLTTVDRVDVVAGTTNLVEGAQPISGTSVSTCTMDDARRDVIFFRAQVTSSTSRALKYKLLTGVRFNGTSGCPVVNSHKKLVGVNVCGHAAAGVAVPIPTVLDSLDAI